MVLLIMNIDILNAVTDIDDNCENLLDSDSCLNSQAIHVLDEDIDEDIEMIGSIIDLERYPIHKDSPAYDQLVEECRTQLKAVGSVDLPGFVLDDVIKKMASEVDNLPSYNRLNIVSAYGASIDDEPEEVNQTAMESWRGQPHPAKRKFAQDTNAVAADQIPLNSLIRQVYDSPMVMRFLARASGKKAMYQFEDEFQSINIMYMFDGCSRAWHYDGTDTVITLLLQKADQGGEYEFAPFIRGEAKGDERFEDVAHLFDGSYDGNIVKNADAGTLNLFNGLRSLHRVRTVYGQTKRIVAVLSYDSQPHKIGSVLKNVVLYGDRVEQIYRRRGTLM